MNTTPAIPGFLISVYTTLGHPIWTILYQKPIENQKSAKNVKLIYRKVSMLLLCI